MIEEDALNRRARHLTTRCSQTEQSVTPFAFAKRVTLSSAAELGR